MVLCMKFPTQIVLDAWCHQLRQDHYWHSVHLRDHHLFQLRVGAHGFEMSLYVQAAWKMSIEPERCLNASYKWKHFFKKSVMNKNKWNKTIFSHVIKTID